MYKTAAHTAGALAALARLGLDVKLAAVPPGLLHAVENTGSLLGHSGATAPRSWSLMGGAGAQLPSNVLQEIQAGGLSPQTRQVFDQQAGGLLSAMQRGQSKWNMPSLAEHLQSAKAGKNTGISTELATNVERLPMR